MQPEVCMYRVEYCIQGNNDSRMIDFLPKVVESRRQRNKIFKVPKENYQHPISREKICKK